MELIAFFLSFILTVLFTFSIIRFSYRKGILDYPKDKSIHTKPIPMMGGVAIFLGFFVTSFFLRTSESLFPLFLASLPIVISGIYDDMKGLNASQKLLIQFISCIIVISFGAVITELNIPFGPTLRLNVFSVPITIFWIILMTNLINIIDGLDGLACGLSAITFFGLLVFIWPVSTNTQILILIILLGTIIAFLIFNFYPAKIFLGNNGSMFLGFTIAYFSLINSQKSRVLPVLFLPCIILVFHIFDIGYAITRRRINGMSIFKGDKRHIHHLMLSIIKDHRTTVLIFYLVSLILAFVMITYNIL